MFLEISTLNLVIYFSYAVFFGTIWLGVVVHRKKTQRDIKLIVDSNSPFNALKELMYKAGEAIVRMITYSVIGMIVTIFLFDLVPNDLRDSLSEIGILAPLLTLFLIVYQAIKAGRYLKGAKEIKEDSSKE